MRLLSRGQIILSYQGMNIQRGGELLTNLKGLAQDLHQHISFQLLQCIIETPDRGTNHNSNAEGLLSILPKY